MIPLFQTIDFETSSTCNRTCPTCIRNSHPDKKATKSFFSKHLLPIKLIRLALDQCVEIGFKGGVWLSYYNEPLQDKRLVRIAKMIKTYPEFSHLAMNTNGDYLSEKLASELDEVFDLINVSLYMDEPIKSQRREWIKSLFHKTRVEVTNGDHIPTHFSPKFNVKELAEKYRDNPCSWPQMRIIINHRRQYLFCCDDVVGTFDLGYFPGISISDYWFGTRHQEMVTHLMTAGNRIRYSYCSTCPRG